MDGKLIIVSQLISNIMEYFTFQSAIFLDFKTAEYLYSKSVIEIYGIEKGSVFIKNNKLIYNNKLNRYQNFNG